MERLTKDQFKTNEEFLLNYAYAKDGEIYVRHYAGDNDVNINKIVRELADRGDVTGVLEGVEDEDIFDTLKEYSDYFSAVMLYLATQAAELREVVKRYEDAEENETLIKLPCKVGDTVYGIWRFYKRSKVVKEEVALLTVDHFTIGDNGTPVMTVCDQANAWYDYEISDIGIAVFLTRETAEAASKERQ